MTFKSVSFASILALLGFAFEAHAQSAAGRLPNLTSGGTTFAQFIGSGSTGVIGAINTIVIPVIIALMFIAFVWRAVYYFFLHGDNEEMRAQGRQAAIWGVLAMAIAFGVWGLLYILLSTLNILPSA